MTNAEVTIAAHYGHKIVVSKYADLDSKPVNYAIECMECFEVLIDQEVK